MKIKSLSKALLFLVFFFPLISYAAEGATFRSLVETFTSTIVNSAITFLIVSATAAFFYGVVKYIFGLRDGDEKVVKEGNQFLIWGMISLFVMISAWGIINYAQNIFGIQGNAAITVPNISSISIGSGSSGNQVGQGGTAGLTPGGVPSNPGNGSTGGAAQPDPTKSQWDGGSKPCPTGSSFNASGICVPVKSGDSEISAIGGAGGAMGASNEDAGAFLNPNEKKMVYAVNGGSLGALLQNNTGSNDEKMSKTIWDMFVKSNPSFVIQKISSFQVFPTSPAGKPSLYGYVQGVKPYNGSWTLGVVVDTHMNNGVLDTAELYNTLMHEGHHITTLSQTDSTPFSACTTYYGYGANCVSRSSYLMNFITMFYSGSRDTYTSKYSDSASSRAFVTEYAKSLPSEDIAETYMKFITDAKPSGTSVMEKKILFFYGYSELVSTRDSVLSKIRNEAQNRGKDADGDGLADTVEQHRGTDPANSDSDGDGVKDAQDADADGDNHEDTKEVDSDGDGQQDWQDTDDDGDGTPDTSDSDDDGDGIADPAPEPGYGENYDMGNNGAFDGTSDEYDTFQPDTNNDGYIDLGSDSASAHPPSSSNQPDEVQGLPVED